MDGRGKLMIAVAWFTSFICSLPQVGNAYIKNDVAIV